MKLLHEGGYSREERELFRPVDHLQQHHTINARHSRGYGVVPSTVG
jgi:hypothetical protein